MNAYQWVAPSGVQVFSSRPQKPTRLMDRWTFVHLPWSLWQWVGKITAQWMFAARR